jgi:hypothetical protein
MRLVRRVAEMGLGGSNPMKTITLLLLLVVCQFSFGQTDTNVIAIGDWSVPVISGYYPLRGRLLIYKPEPQNSMAKKVGLWNGARVYVELQVIGNALNDPTEIFVNGYLPMHAEMRDGHDKLIGGNTNGWHMWDGPMPPRYTATLPFDSTLRLRASTGVGTQNPDDLLIAVPEQAWSIRLEDTNDYYLSATFSPPTNRPSCLNYHVWQGTLQLPKLKIPTEVIRKP